MSTTQKPYQPYAAAHKTLKGPGDARPTALQVIKDEGAISALKGKTILITGCSSGLGVETARALYETGAKLFLSARNMPKLQKVIDEIVVNASIKDAPKPEALEMHLDSLASVRKAAEEFKTRSSELNVLICNAGIMACPYSKTEDGFELQFGTNHVAHFLLFQLLKDQLIESAAKSGSDSRVITVSSNGHRFQEVRLDDPNFEKGDYNSWASYGQSKTANVWMANSISRHYGSKNLQGFSVHPGGIATELGRHTSPDELASFGLTQEVLESLFKSPEQGAATQVWAAVAQHLEGKGGLYLEDAGETSPVDESAGMTSPGYAKWAYDEEKEEKLWKLSLDAISQS